ncbi:hypothetical protein B0H15DRAFT_1022964 [Mycena belliarum]|uniref:Thioesterase domain-containing protein n=1 Tax=Mycena belliarum TaxID=1033014 RepID=A0AAD6XNF2_9AGAR|nr:hypothetical protein B0H15DRAFT_1022964 [Mycena belliae]
MPLDSAGHARYLAILHATYPDATLARIQGNAPRAVKELALKCLDIYHAPAPSCFAADAGTLRTAVTEVSLDPGPLEDTRVLTLVCELEVTDASLDSRDVVANAFIVTIIDECVSAAVAALDRAQGGPGTSGVTLSITTVFHNPVLTGSTLRLVNRTLEVAAETTSCRCEVWDLTQRRLAASAVFAGMQSSPPKSLARL